MNAEIKIKTLKKRANSRLPIFAMPRDAGADLFAVQEAYLAPNGGRAAVPVGISIEIPEGYCGLITPRSGLAVNHGVTVLNSPGVIDSGYRGEVAAIMVNLDPHLGYTIHIGDRIAQMVIVQVPAAEYSLSDNGLSASERNNGGFGSTGQK